MHEDQQKQAQFDECAKQLSVAAPPSGLAAGSILTKVMALVTALKAGDLAAILKAVYDLLGEFVSDGTTNFGTPVAGLGMDLGTLLSILATILGLLGKK